MNDPKPDWAASLAAIERKGHITVLVCECGARYSDASYSNPLDAFQQHVVHHVTVNKTNL